MSKLYRITEFAKRIGRTPSTIRRWESEGKMTPKRLLSGHRYFDESDVRQFLGRAPDKRSTVVYCRVSRSGQKDDLAVQVAAMETYCLGAGIRVDEWIQEIGSGTNVKRKRFLELLDRIMAGEIERLIVAHQDRLMRFGFECVAHIAAENGCAIEVVNIESLSPQQEVVEDLLEILRAFRSRLPEMSRYEKQIKADYPHCKRSLNKEEPTS